jgi:hypothetical protein
LDCNNDGDFLDAEDVVIPGTISDASKPVVYQWDRKNGLNTTLPTGATFNVRIELIESSSEVHFPLVDVESNWNGLKIVLNETPGGSRIYWNDNSDDMNPAPNQQASVPRKNDIDGSLSLNGSHAWSGTEGEEKNFYGQNRLIDTWTFAKEISQPMMLVMCPAISISGKVWGDSNEDGEENGGSESGTNGGSSSLTAYLIDHSDPDRPIVIDKASIGANGTYQFANVPASRTYTVRLSNDASGSVGATTFPQASLPQNFIGTGELMGANNGAGTGSDPLINGDITVHALESNVTGVNFGISKSNTTHAVNDENSTWVEVPVSGNVTTNDFDRELNTQTFQSFLSQTDAETPISSGATLSGTDRAGNPVENAGQLTFLANGTYTYTPAPGFVGNISVPYQICDDQSPRACDVAYLEITVAPFPEHNSVIANNDEYISFGDPVSNTVFANDQDPQGDEFTLTSFVFTNQSGVVQDGTVGTPVVLSGVDEKGNFVANAGSMTLNADGSFVFVPSNGFAGEVTLDYTITDDNASPADDHATVKITVFKDKNGPANDPPFGGDDFVYTSKNTSTDGSFITNDTDPNANPLTVKDESGTPVVISTSNAGNPLKTLTTAQGGTVLLKDDGTYTYTPPVDYVGPDYVVYEICDLTDVAPQPLCAEATIHMLVAEKTIQISGQVWHDLNGNAVADGAEKTLSGDKSDNVPTSEVTGEDLYVSLVDASTNEVVKVVQVGLDGTYSFGIVPEGDYKIILTAGDVSPTIGATLLAGSIPDGWQATGTSQLVEGVATPNLTSLNNVIVLGAVTADVTGANFGMQQPPVTDNSSYELATTPVSGSFLPLNGTVSASSPADPDAAELDPPVASDQDDSGLTFFLVGQVTTSGGTATGNPELYYLIPGTSEPTLVNEENFPNGITDFDPSRLSVLLQGTGYSGISFDFKVVDEAGASSNVSTYSISWSPPLPVKWESVSVTDENGTANIYWTTTEELGVSEFRVQHSMDGFNWETLAAVPATNQARASYQYTHRFDRGGVHYYRIQNLDVDGSHSFSQLVSLRSSLTTAPFLYPNPVTGGEFELVGVPSGITSVKVFDMTGRQLSVTRKGMRMYVGSLPSGRYMMQVAYESGEMITKTFVIK